MGAIIAVRLSYLAETHQLLPESHTGGRKQRSTEHALHSIIDTIYETWNTRQGQVASLLLLDVFRILAKASWKVMKRIAW